ALYFILKKTPAKRDSYILLSVGLVLISISFFNNYNFSDFSRMQFFVSLISSLLILAATLQRATKEINFYLKISPALLLLLSFFFFNSITMLLYSVATLFLFTMLLLWSRTQNDLRHLLRLTFGLFMLSLPAIVVMFLAFPRISFEKADYGFRADSYATSGYEGKMHVSDKEFIPSKRAVMEVYFGDVNISDNHLYFRGSTLATKDGITWEEEPYAKPKERLIAIEEKISYDITLYPHAKHWVYALDLPAAAPLKTTLANDYTITSERPLYEKKRYTLTSALSYRLLSSDVSKNRAFDASKSPQTAAMLAPLQKLEANKATKAAMLVQFFADQNLSYTTKPKNIDFENFLDSFLFEAKNGYCVHFASAFAQSARFVGIPSRVVTGFKGSKENRVENYLLITSADAHAWVELYLDEAGWVRFEPTATAVKNLDMPQTQEAARAQKTVFEKVNLQFMYVRYLITKWVLDYNRLKQVAILKNLLSDTLYLLQFLGAIAALIALCVLIFYMVHTSKKGDPIAHAMKKLLGVLEKRGVHKQESETMEHFLKRAEVGSGVSMQKLSRLYHALKYGTAREDISLEALKEEIAKTTREVARKNPS
ncbi:MAG: DUF3488 and transglutaminase-like domain-containing protein, partial [Thiovulaceae bacterium]|nr:DUF3488 and transglutaminase-like domain-containing protein [Sulfurimonadaceae bacterium]